MKVLVIEDAPDVVDTIGLCFTIRWPDTKVVSTGKGRKAAELVGSEAPDVVILDLGLPDMDGLKVLQEIRTFSDVPVIIVTAKGEEMARVKGLELGADDYMVKPFSHTELLARVKAVLRRTQMPELWDGKGTVSGRGFVVDLAKRRVSVEGREVPLTPTEWKLLSYMVRNEGRVISSQMLADKVWGVDHLSDAAIRAGVRRLRLKLGDDPQKPRIIRAHRGMGYSLALPR
jgi:two-component system KDP operon response regulator KdpE